MRHIRQFYKYDKRIKFYNVYEHKFYNVYEFYNVLSWCIILFLYYYFYKKKQIKTTLFHTIIILSAYTWHETLPCLLNG